MTPELKTSCEVVFQEHKASADPITWKKDAFRGRMSIGLCELAKETLVKKNIIYFPKPAKKTITILNPVVATAPTFEEAVAMIESKAPLRLAAIKEELPVYTETFSLEHISYADVDTSGHGIAIAEEKWYLRPLFFYVVWPVSSAIVSVLIAYLMSECVAMTYR